MSLVETGVGAKEGGGGSRLTRLLLLGLNYFENLIINQEPILVKPSFIIMKIKFFNHPSYSHSDQRTSLIPSTHRHFGS